jgi:hypothetical protein
MSTKYITVLIFLLSLEGLTQTIERQVLGSAGTSATTTSHHWSYTIGEPCTLPFSSTTVVLTQGFQQPSQNQILISLASNTGDIIECGEEPEVVEPIVLASCGGLEKSWVYLEYNNFCGGMVSRLWTISDACGNQVNWTQYFPIVDSTPPSIFGGATTEFFLPCNGSIPAAPVFFDACDPTVNVVQNIQVVDPSLTLVEYIASDDCGNSTSVLHTVHFSCCAAPSVLFEPSDMTVECGNQAIIEEPVFSDVNSNDLVIEHNISSLSFGCGYTELHTWTATNSCGASKSSSLSVFYQDTQGPVYPVNTTTYYDISCGQSLPAPPVFTDACDQYLTVTEFSSQIDENTTKVTYSAIDDCGNFTSVNYIIYSGCCTSACTGDLDFDGVVNVSDLLLFVGEYGSSGICLLADLDNDGTVNVVDLLLFSGAFGNTCE